MVPLSLSADRTPQTIASILTRWRKRLVRGRPPETDACPRVHSSACLLRSPEPIVYIHGASRRGERFPLYSHRGGRVCRGDCHAHCCRFARPIAHRLSSQLGLSSKKGLVCFFGV